MKLQFLFRGLPRELQFLIAPKATNTGLAALLKSIDLQNYLSYSKSSRGDSLSRLYDVEFVSAFTAADLQARCLKNHLLAQSVASRIIEN